MPSIYIVEDDTDILAIESYALKGAGFEAQGFESAAGFNAVMKEKLPDLILLDIAMPGMDGLQTLTRIRQHPEWKNIHVIFLTAAADKTTIVRAAQLKVKDYVKKPFTPDELISRVEKHIAPDIDDPEIQNIFKQLDSLGL